ncbi:MAG: TVP38/TMEM64 family protein [Promethearchaeota archaeon]
MDEDQFQNQESSKEPFFQRAWHWTKKETAQLWEMTKRAFRDHSKTTWIWIGIFFAVLAFTVVLWAIQIYNPEWLFDKVIHWVVIPINKIGFWGHVIFFIVMGLQAVLLPIPSEAILLSSGLIWGWWGLIDGIIGSMFAGIITYYMVLKGGRPLAEKFAGKDAIDILDHFIVKYGAWSIFVLRAFPFMAFDPVSFAAGLTKIKTRTYLVATFFGSIFRCVFYIALGDYFLPSGDINWYIDPVYPERLLILRNDIKDGAGPFNVMSISIVLIGVAFIALYQFVLMPYLKKKVKKEKDAKSKSIIHMEQRKEKNNIEHKSNPSETST